MLVTCGRQFLAGGGWCVVYAICHGYNGSQYGSLNYISTIANMT